MGSTEDHRPRITRDLVSRSSNLKKPDSAFQKVLEDEKEKIVNKAIEALHKQLKAAGFEKQKLSDEIGIQKRDFTVQLQALIDEKTVAQERAVYHMQRFEDATSTLNLIKQEHATITNQLRVSIEQLERERNELSTQVSDAERNHRETQNKISLMEQQSQQELEQLRNEIASLQEMNKQYEQLFLDNQKRAQERIIAEEQNVMVAEDEFDRGFLKEMDDQCQQQAQVIQRLEKDNHDLTSTLSEYQQRYPTLASLDEEQHRIERELRECKRIRDENNRLKQENEQLKQQASDWMTYLETENIDRYNSPKEIIFELSQGRAAMRDAERRAKQLEQELEAKETHEKDLVKTIEELRNNASELEQARKREEIEKEALAKDRAMLEIHRDLLDHQLKVMSEIEEANLGSDNANVEFPMTKRIEELEGLLKDVQEEATKARQEAVQLKLSCVNERVLELKDNPASVEQHVRQEQLTHLREENRLLLQQLSSDLNIGKRRREEEGDDGIINGDENPAFINVPISTISNLQSQVDELNKLIASRSKRMMRLQQVFGQKVDEMDRTIQSLLGYSLDFRSDGAVRVQSIFADGTELAFVFKSDDDDQGTIGIVGTRKEEYMQQLQGTYDTFVLDQNNIPGFLSSVTLELMNSIGEEIQLYGDEDEGDYHDENDELDEVDSDNEYIDDNHPGQSEQEPITIDDDE